MNNKRVLMVAAENDGLQGCKVGGIGDVVRDVPPVLAGLGWVVDVVTPSYGFLHRTPGATLLTTLNFSFAGAPFSVGLYLVPGRQPLEGVRHMVVDHALFYNPRDGRPTIYHDDPPQDPFATDATKSALLCQAVAEALIQGAMDAPRCIHCHDWHAAFLLILRRYHETYRALQIIPTAHTVHNLALQGVRPLAGHASSLASWFPGLQPSEALADPRWPDCVNPMAAGIRLADRVHLVSPTYAREVLEPSDPPRYYGGEGLEQDLVQARRGGRLWGILNGCEYPAAGAQTEDQKLTRTELLRLLKAELLGWISRAAGVSPAHIIALERINQLLTSEDHAGIVITSVGRVVEQKMLLLRASGSDGVCGLDGILGPAAAGRGLLILLGTGDKQYEDFLLQQSAHSPNFLFLRGYSEVCAEALYANGDLFVMPSSFEPCGISQMLSMRNGQPCVVHGVGGLRDTVTEGEDGFVFEGDSVEQQVRGLAAACGRAVELFTNHKDRWEALRSCAAGRRFEWTDSVKQYIDKLYLAVPEGAV